MKAPLTSVPSYLEIRFVYRLVYHVGAPCAKRHTLGEVRKASASVLEHSTPRLID